MPFPQGSSAIQRPHLLEGNSNSDKLLVALHQEPPPVLVSIPAPYPMSAPSASAPIHPAAVPKPSNAHYCRCWECRFRKTGRWRRATSRIGLGWVYEMWLTVRLALRSSSQFISAVVAVPAIQLSSCSRHDRRRSQTALPTLLV